MGLSAEFKRDPWPTVFVATVSALAYGLTSAPTIYVGDTGELVTAAATFGLAHPTGYPFYLLLGRVWMTLLFFLEPARAMNLLSVAAGAAAISVTQLLFRLVGVRRVMSIAGALMLAVTTSFWSQATIARVYTPNLLMMLLAGFYLALFLRDARPRSLHLAVLWTGLGMAIHTISVIMAPALLLALLDRRLDMKARLLTPLWLLPGAACYLYIPVAASFAPAQNWGNPSTWKNLIAYLSREEYWGRRFVTSGHDAWRVVAFYLGLVPRELGWLGAGGALLGLWRWSRERRVLFVAATSVIAINVLLMVLHGSRNDIYQWTRYVLPALATLCLAAAVGLDALGARLLKTRAVAWDVAVLLLVLIPAIWTWQSQDRSTNTVARDINERILDGLPQDAVLIADGDNFLFPLSYLRNVEGRREDVTLVLQGINELSSMTIHPDRQGIFFTHHQNLDNEDLRLVPRGLVFRLIPTAKPAPPLESWADWAVPSLEDPSGQGELDFLARSLVGDYQLMKAIHYENLNPLLSLEAARANLEAAYDNPNNTVNSGLLVQRNGMLRLALACYDKALDLDERSEVAKRHRRGVVERLGRPGTSDQVREIIRSSVTAFEAKKHEAALQVLRSGLARFPASDRLRYNQAALAIMAGDYVSAGWGLLATLDLKPGDELATRDVGELEKRLPR